MMEQEILETNFQKLLSKSISQFLLIFWKHFKEKRNSRETAKFFKLIFEILNSATVIANQIKFDVLRTFTPKFIYLLQNDKDQIMERKNFSPNINMSVTLTLEKLTNIDENWVICNEIMNHI